MLHPKAAAAAAGIVLALASGAGAAVAATHHGTPVKGSKHHAAHTLGQTSTTSTNPCPHMSTTTTTTG